MCVCGGEGKRSSDVFFLPRHRVDPRLGARQPRIGRRSAAPRSTGARAQRAAAPWRGPVVGRVGVCWHPPPPRAEARQEKRARARARARGVTTPRGRRGRGGAREGTTDARAAGAAAVAYRQHAPPGPRARARAPSQMSRERTPAWRKWQASSVTFDDVRCSTPCGSDGTTTLPSPEGPARGADGSWKMKACSALASLAGPHNM